jgi:phosphoglycolate phosphatase
LSGLFVWDTVYTMKPRDSLPGTLLIFDLDGTLYRTESSFLHTMRVAYANHGVPYAGDDAVLGMVGETFPAFVDWLALQGFPHDSDALSREIATHEHRSIERHGKLYPEVAETLLALKRAGYSLAICTNGDMRYTSAVLGKFGLLDLFDAIKTHGDAQQTKTQMIAELLEQLQPAQAFMIGDRYHDFIAGQANGCTVIATTYGFAADGESNTVDARLERFADLPDIVRRFLST